MMHGNHRQSKLSAPAKMIKKYFMQNSNSGDLRLCNEKNAINETLHSKDEPNV